MSLWQAVTWDVARAGGFTAYILLALSVAVGLALTLRMQSLSRWPRIINSELHNFFTLLALIFTVVHVLAVWIDPFTRFDWGEVFIPFVSHYRPFWMALGIVALYLSIAVGISTWLRPLIGYTWWRRLHLLTLGAYALVTVHGIATGSDTQTWWGLAIYAGSVLLVGGLLWKRLLVPVDARGRSHPVLATLIGITTLVGVIWVAAGPLQPGWNTLANNGNGSGARTAQAASPSISQNSNPPDSFAAPFSASLQGTMTQSGPDENGTETIHFTTTLSNGAQGSLNILLQGVQDNNSGGEGNTLSITSTQVTLGKDTASPLYSGSLTDLRAGRRWRMVALLTKVGTGTSQLNVQIEMQVSADGQVSGQIQGVPVHGSPISPGSSPGTQQL